MGAVILRTEPTMGRVAELIKQIKQLLKNWKTGDVCILTNGVKLSDGKAGKEITNEHLIMMNGSPLLSI